MPGPVVIHVSDAPQDLQRGIAAANTIAMSGGMVVRIIVNGPAIEAVTRAAETVFPGEYVSIEACERALMSRDLNRSDVQAAIGTVSSAVVALARAQHQGAAYIRI